MKENIEHNESREHVKEKQSHQPMKIIIGLVIMVIIIVVVTMFFQLNTPGNDLSTDDHIEEFVALDENGDKISPDKSAGLSKSRNLDSDVLALMDIEGIGLFFADAEKSMTLYVLRGGGFCSSECYEKMKPYLTDSPYTLPEGVKENHISAVEIAGSDNTYQYAWNGDPLYYYVDDEKIGSVLGDGFKNLWTIARP